MADTFTIETSALRKTYDAVEALRGLDLQVPAGSICGFLGRNGAGKTTTLKILMGMAHATGGEARVFGLDVGSAQSSLEIRRRVGFVSEEKDLYPYMTVTEIVGFTAALFPRWRADLVQRYIRSFGLPPNAKVKTLSRGSRTKLALLLAMCRSAELLVLDEPTSGLDPAMVEEVLQLLVTQAADEGVTVFFSSHQIAEVEQIADHLIIIDRGRTVVAGALDDIRENFRRIQLVFDGEAPRASFLSPGIRGVRRNGRVLTIVSSTGAEPLLEEARALHPISVDVSPVTLKEIFLDAANPED